MADPLRLAMMTFPQRWDGAGTLTLGTLLVPTVAVDPLTDPLIGADPATPAFALGAPEFRVHINEKLVGLPSDGSGFDLVPTVTSAASAPAPTFKLLSQAVTTAGASMAATVAPPTTTRIRKALPPSYMQAGGNPPDGNLTTTDDDFGCAIREAPWTKPPPPGPRTVGWGEIISYALRQPIVATRMGLLYELSVTLGAAHADALKDGGYVFAALDAGDPWASAATANPGALRLHAARIPALSASRRPVFAAVQFVVDQPGAVMPEDAAFAAAGAYSDGFAKLVHTTQPTTAEATIDDGSIAPATDLGIQVGWDDEQVVRWNNDQLTLLQARRDGKLDDASQTPLGVLGYRIDVADVTAGGPPHWQSLVQVDGTLPDPFGGYTAELAVEPAPTRPNTAAEAWLPRYFANWRGGSLCEPDPIPRALTGRTPPPALNRTASGLTTLLSYGRTYAFRVRLADLSSGGPLPTGDDPVDPPPNATAIQTFRRLLPPKSPTLVQDPPAATNDGRPNTLTVTRPLIGYPEVLYTHLGDSDAARDEIRTALVDHATSGAARTAGLPDPDVDAVELEVAVRHPLHDEHDGVFQTLYKTTRPLASTTGTAPLLADPGTEIPLVYVEAPSILGWPPPAANSGPLPIPRGRDVQITVRTKLRPGEPDYFGDQAQAALASTVAVRCEPATEPALLGPADAAEPVRGFLFRRPPDVAAPGLVAQLAEELGVAASGDSLTSPPGRRIVFGASKGLRHTISADGETLTFGATSELLRNWVVAIVVDLERDWTWDGLEPSGVTVLRGASTDTEATAGAVGAITVPRVLGSAATTRPIELERGRTRLVFLDAIDPHEPVPDSFPESLAHRWFLRPDRKPPGPPSGAAPGSGRELADSALDLVLPIAIPPAQVPAIASVGLALSPYAAGPAYASSEQRERSLWIELTEPIANQVGDALFARVLAHGADPLLYEALPEVVSDANPPLPLDPELVRAIVPADTDDRAGETAMTKLIRAPGSDRHFLLPLPPGVDPDDPELFGFYSYEFRVGHSGSAGDPRWWSTANARFGSPLRVVGVQHPPPALSCHAGRIGHAHDQTNSIISGLRRTGALRFPIEPSVIGALAGGAASEHPLPIAVKDGPPSLIVVTAPYATPVLDGRPLVRGDEPPRTQLWFFLYAQAVQADAASMRNILLATAPGTFLTRRQRDGADQLERLLAHLLTGTPQRDRLGYAVFHQAEVESLLERIHLPGASPLSVLAVELLPGGTVSEPKAEGAPTDAEAKQAAVRVDARIINPSFPFGRILRTSPLMPIEPYC